MMDDLYEETLDKLREYGKSEDDIVWVGTKDAVVFGSPNIRELFSGIEYDSGFGGQEINPDLVVVGKEWWLERHEYDGSEWWEFKQLPVMPNMKCKVPITYDYDGVGWDFDPDEGESQ